jgi:hypothetical protein
VDLEVYSSGKTVSYSGSESGGGGGDLEGGGGDGGNDAYVMRASGSGQGQRRHPSYPVEEPVSSIQSVEREHRFEDSLASYTIDSADLGGTLLSPSDTLRYPLTPSNTL